LFNAHGDVVQLTDYTGVLVKDYRYDAFGVEADIDPSDTNPWRYCGEYFDLLNVGESGDSAGSTTLTTLPEVTYVSDMDYTEDYLYWPLRADRSIDNNTLTINGVEYEKGLGSHAYSNISVELNGNYDVFSSVIGIDDEVADRSQPGNSTFVVLLDGEEVYNSGVMTPGMAEEVYVDVKGKRTMQLVTQLNGDYMNDHTDWADAKLLTWHTTDYISDMDYTEDYLYWPLRADRSIDNHPITLDGVEYAKGLGSHAYSKISVELNGEYNLFGSVIGLDDEVMGMSVVGNSTFKVLLDGEEVYNSGEMTPGMTDTILLDVSDMDLLELITENNGDYMYDHTDWADARLIKYATEKPRGAVGTYYLRARYYQPTTGRFMSEDSIRDGLNYYTYAMNNPLFFKDPFGFAAVQLRQWFNEKLSYIQSVYKNTSGSLNWTDYTKTATIHMSANGYSGHAAFTVGKDGSYIDSNSRMWVDESLLWQVFGNVIDPPAQVKSAKEVVVEQLETIPLTNYLEAAFGKDLYGNSLNTDQRLDKVAVGLEIGLDAMTNAYVMAGLKYDIKMVDQASKALNMSKRQTAAFKAEIEDIKHGEGRSNNYTFEWKRLLEIGREVMQWTK
jgi:RHS repeat-associated protein